MLGLAAEARGSYEDAVLAYREAAALLDTDVGAAFDPHEAFPQQLTWRGVACLLRQPSMTLLYLDIRICVQTVGNVHHIIYSLGAFLSRPAAVGAHQPTSTEVMSESGGQVVRAPGNAV